MIVTCYSGRKVGKHENILMPEHKESRRKNGSSGQDRVPKNGVIEAGEWSALGSLDMFVCLLALTLIVPHFVNGPLDDR